MKEPLLQAMRDMIQEDVGQRGLGTDPAANLLSACAGDFAAACHSIAGHPKPAVAVVTGFFIPHARPPAGETDGPLGALFLARALLPLGIPVVLVTDGFCARALTVGLAACGLAQSVPLITLPDPARAATLGVEEYGRDFLSAAGPLSHLIALERVGPSHTLGSLQAQLGSAEALGETYLEFLHQVPPEHQDRCHTMRGLDITEQISPAHYLFETARRQVPSLTTIGIGDGGNEIGMGKISWDIIQRNIPQGGLVACRIATDFLLVCGVSNWGAYGLGTGVRCLRGLSGSSDDLFDPGKEGRLLRTMVQDGPLVDGRTGLATVTVDGLAFDRYVEKLSLLGRVG